MGRMPMLLPLILLILGILGVNALFPSSVVSPVVGQHSFHAEVISVRELAVQGQRIIVDIDSVDGAPISSFKASVRTFSLFPSPHAGENIRFSGRMNTLAPPPDIPDFIDLNKSLRREGVVAAVSVMPDSLVVCGRAGGVMAWMRRLNLSLQSRLASADISTEAYRLASAMFLGNSDDILPGERQTYSASGLSHLLALSGTHVAIITSLISLALFPFYIARRRIFAYVLTIIALWFYALLTGLSPSVLRAVIMASIYLLSRMLERHSVPMNSLLVAAFVILLFKPSDLYSAGFQMSFAAVVGIIIFFPILNQFNRRKHPWLYRIWSYPALSISATILTSVVAACHFHTFPIWFLLANLLALPFIPLLVCGSALLLIFPYSAGLCRTFDLLASALQWIAQWVSNLPGAIVSDIYLPLWLGIAAICLLVAFGCGLRYNRAAISIGSLILLVGCFSLNAAIPRQYPNVEYFRHDDYRHSQLILRNGPELLLFTTASIPTERADKLDQYRFLLRDYIALRHLDSLKLAPPATHIILSADTIPITP